jgi:hypothetical protein
MPTLKRHKCRAPVVFHAFMKARCYFTRQIPLAEYK